MGGKNLGQIPFPFVLAQPLQEIDQGERVIAAAVGVLQAEIIGLAFGAAGKFQERERHRQPQPLLHRQAHRPADKDQRQGEPLEQSGFGSPFGGVAGGDVGDFVRQHPGQLRFRLRLQDESRVYVDESAR